MCDLIVKNAKIYDGCGKEPYIADILINNGIIEDIGDFKNIEATEIIDAKGLVVFPGFIDTHTHSDAILLNNPAREEAISQGITTEINGSCGIGVLPMTKIRDGYIKSVKGIVGDIDFSKKFSNIDEYINVIGNTGINYAIQAAHSPIRAEAIGMNDIDVDDVAMSKILKLTKSMFEDGACALSTGLAYYPASFSDTDELVKMCEVAKEFNAPITVHLRTAINKFFDKNTFDAVEETIKIAEQSGVHLHFSHRRTRAGGFGNAKSLTDVIEEGIAKGLKITADFYPYPVGCGYVAVNLPLWAMDGSYEEVIKRLNDPDTRYKIARDMEENNKNLADGIFISATKNIDYIGKTYSQVAEENNEKVADMLVRFLAEENLDGGYRPTSDFTSEEMELFEKDCAFLITKPYYMIGSDTLPQHRFIHPRTTSAFPKMIRIAREHNVDFSLLANRMCALPADTFGLKNRGRIVKGAYADITIFDKETIKENSSFDKPWEKPDGIKYVIVNGKVALRDEKYTNTLAGVAIKRS